MAKRKGRKGEDDEISGGRLVGKSKRVSSRISSLFSENFHVLFYLSSTYGI